MSNLDMSDVNLSYCVLVCHVWLLSLGGLFFFKEETEWGVDLGERGARSENWEEWREEKLSSGFIVK